MLKWLAVIVMGAVVATALYGLLGRSLAQQPADGLTNVSTGIGQPSILSEPEAIRLGLELARREHGLREVVWGVAARQMTLGEEVWLRGGYASPEGAKFGRDPAMPVWLVVIRGPVHPSMPGIQPDVHYASLTFTLDAVTGEEIGLAAGPATSPLLIPVPITPGVAPDLPVITPRPTHAYPLPVPKVAPTATDRPLHSVTLAPQPTRTPTLSPTSTPTPLPPYPQPTARP